MSRKAITVAELLDQLEVHYGKQVPTWPSDPYEFLVWWHCGYPQSDERCAKGWNALTSQTSIEPASLLAAKPAALTAALRAGGMVPELRAMRLKEIAFRVQEVQGGDLRAALVGPLDEARRLLKSFPNIGDPGADRILLFAGIAVVAAVPSNNPAVIVRVLRGRERENYAMNYKQSRQLLESEVNATINARSRAYLLLKRHGQELCKRTNPRCQLCPIQRSCAYFTGSLRGRSAAAPIPGSRR